MNEQTDRAGDERQRGPSFGGGLIRFPKPKKEPIVPCPSRATATLGVNEPTEVRCALLAGHAGRHIFHIEWENTRG